MAAGRSRLITLNAPVSDDSLLSNKEKIILFKSSKQHGCVFPPWKAEPSSKEFVDSFVDGTEFQLSAEQTEALHGWKRPSDDNTVDSDVLTLLNTDLVQDITTDCSVVASLCAEAARNRKLGCDHEGVLQSFIYPQGRASQNGKYIFKLHFNGCFRKVTIDDRLPLSLKSRALHVVDRNNCRNTLPALIEKAYLKVRGGYDFPGSNPGTDLWVMTAWIPEQLFLQSEDVIPHAFWKRIFNAFDYGDVIITLGTDRLSSAEEEVLGLAGGHAYAVVDMKEHEGYQLFLIKNPWSKGGTWSGYIDPSNPSVKSQPKQSEPLAPGTFWMDLYNVIQYFQTIYLNWNPGLFGFRRDTHFAWDVVKMNPGSLTRNPQYLLSSQKGGTVFLVLTKHFQEHDTAVHVGRSSGKDQGYLGLSAFATAHRLTVTRRPLFKSNYIDAPNVLLRFDFLPNETYVIVVSEQELPRCETNFTLSAFSTHSLTQFSPAPEKYTHTSTIEGSWTVGSAQGNVSHEDYDKNPQFSLTITEASQIGLLIESSNGEFAVHVKLVWADGNRITLPLTTRDICGDSGEYVRGCALAEIPYILPGTYTIVCSTFEPGQLGSFDLRVSAMTSRFTVKPIPHEDAGMLVHHLPNAVFRRDIDRVLAPIEVSHNSRLRFNVQPAAQRSQPSLSLSPLKISVEYGQGPNKSTLLTSGDFSNQRQIRTSAIDVSPKTTTQAGPGLWLVVERLGSSQMAADEEVQVAVLSDIPGVRVGSWGRESDVPIEQLRERFAASSLLSR